MGSARERPARLAEKLLHIRNSLGLSQGDMLSRLGMDEKIYRFYISNYETGRREPTLLVLLEYARAANVHVEALIDDELDLPARLPAQSKSVGVRRASAPRSKSKKRSL
ncbi:MAG TPA: helix-turn-helix transcriptional regulator [Pyrinomonadaceae bacterium]|nr:helix-turn-helix transcriptional regulator [Pyrinomonadaceae bacterium]